MNWGKKNPMTKSFLFYLFNNKIIHANNNVFNKYPTLTFNSINTKIKISLASRKLPIFQNI